MRYLLLISLLCITVGGRVSAQQLEQVEVSRLLQTTTSWNGASLPAFRDGTPEITIEKYLIPGHTTLAWHQHPLMNAGVILSGELVVETQAGDRIMLRPGDAVAETVDTWHRGINEKDEPVEILVFYMGVIDAPLIITEE